MKKCPSSIRCRDSNPRPLERESIPITTRPGLPPSFIDVWRLFTGHNWTSSWTSRHRDSLNIDHRSKGTSTGLSYQFPIIFHQYKNFNIYRSIACFMFINKIFVLPWRNKPCLIRGDQYLRSIRIPITDLWFEARRWHESRHQRQRFRKVKIKKPIPK